MNARGLWKLLSCKVVLCSWILRVSLVFVAVVSLHGEFQKFWFREKKW